MERSFDGEGMRGFSLVSGHSLPRALFAGVFEIDAVTNVQFGFSRLGLYADEALINRALRRKENYKGEDTPRNRK